MASRTILALELVCGANFSWKLMCGAGPGDLGGSRGSASAENPRKTWPKISSQTAFRYPRTKKLRLWLRIIWDQTPRGLPSGFWNTKTWTLGGRPRRSSTPDPDGHEMALAIGPRKRPAVGRRPRDLSVSWKFDGSGLVTGAQTPSPTPIFTYTKLPAKQVATKWQWHWSPELTFAAHSACRTAWRMPDLSGAF